MERGRVGGLEEMKGKEGRNDRGRKGRLKSVCCCHYNHSLISHEGLSVLLSVAMVTRSFHFSGSRDFVGVNYFTAISFNSSNTQTMSPLALHVCTCAQTITILPVTVSYRYKNLATPLDGRHGCENPMV